MFAIVRYLRSPSGLTPRSAGPRPRVRKGKSSRTRRFGLPVIGLCAIVCIAAAAWVMAGGELTRFVPFSDSGAENVVDPPNGVPVHLDSLPSGSNVVVDGARRGRTPLDMSLVPGHHTVVLRHADMLDEQQQMTVTDTGESVLIRLWRQQPSVVPVGAVYPGASLADARFLADGQVALVIGLPVSPSGLNGPTSMRELWRLDPLTGRSTRLRVPGEDPRVPVLALAPDGEQIAYVRPGFPPPTSISVSGSRGSAANPPDDRDTVWIASVDGSSVPQRVFEVDAPVTRGYGDSSEHIVDLVWTPDSTGVVVISRQGGPPTRTRLSLVQPGLGTDSRSTVQVAELVLLPADIAPGAASVDPSAQWLALMAHGAASQSGSDSLTLCLVDLRTDGVFRELADLGSAQRAPTVPAIAWAADDGSHSPGQLVFVAPAPGAASRSSGMFDLFAAFRVSAPPAGLFLADLQATDLVSSQPRRLGTITNVLGPMWRRDDTLLGFVRQDDGFFGLRTIDTASARIADAGVRLQTGAGQGSGLSARWDAEHGRVLLLSRPGASTSTGATGSGPLQAWLVSFVDTSLR